MRSKCSSAGAPDWRGCSGTRAVGVLEPRVAIARVRERHEMAEGRATGSQSTAARAYRTLAACLDLLEDRRREPS
jgi:hypothetical protein